ncbi:MAG: hypothetical protein JRJ65_08930 [Deltaproteobacteria bacterium]|nr:hypothetical protein [Deltaproteobacteria bacterium]
MLSNLKTYFNLVLGLRNFLKETLTLEQCKEIVKKRMEERDINFLDIVKKGIYENKNSPYLKLLDLAGCEFGDIKSSVSKDGIEQTLQNLRESGVYLTYDEFKGRKDVIRGEKTFKFEASDFNSPYISHLLALRTGGTTGKAEKASVDFEYMFQNAIYRALVYDVYKLWEVPFALWLPILPGSAGISALFRSTKIGNPPLKWFSQIDREYITPSFKHKFRTNGVIYAGRLFGVKLPTPEFVDLNSAVKVAEWAVEMIREFSGCCISTYPSSAVRICHAAKERGWDMDGLKFTVGGEPLTRAKKNEIKSVGADIVPNYGFTEVGAIGLGCADPVEPDEVHFLRDSFAMIQHKRKPLNTGLPVNAFLFTSFAHGVPKILLNVETGDYGVVESRGCGCGFDKLGFSEHIHGIRSFGKFTSEGMNLAGTHLIRIIEEILPIKYGGDSTDYQLIEEEDEQGITRLNIFVSPSVGEINERDLLETVLSELRAENKTIFMPEIFSQAETFRIKRAYPISTERGKILSLHIKR